MNRVSGAALAALLLLAGAAVAQPLSEAQREEVVRILRDVLTRDPSILRDAIAAMQADDERREAEARRDAIRAEAAALLRDPADPVRGNPAGDVTIVEFFDVRCTFCRRLHPELEALIAADRGVRVVMKDLPILGPQSVWAARALLAAHRQGGYARLQDALLRMRGEPTEAAIQAEARRLGLDWQRLRRDMEDPAIMARIEANIALAQRLGISGTPALVIGDTLVPGAVDQRSLAAMVAAARAAQRGG
ncbi:MAG: DsbA family protein [Acetobacteraceae bacterium]|nr:DsbA family protein [Acetobacteraceae bacterium]